MVVLLVLTIIIFILALGVAGFMQSDAGQKLYQKMVTTEVAQITYPVYIGHNGVCYREDLIEQAFDGLNRYWEIFYFDNVVCNANYVITYQFRVYEPLDTRMKDGRRLSLVRNIAEKVLKHHLNMYGWHIPVDNLIAVTLHEDVLSVMIATSYLGLPEIKRLRKLARYSQ